jgi:hypothetical protein
MAKKARDKQQGLPGIVNKPTKAIEKKAQEYADALYERMTLQEQENVLRDELAEMMGAREVDLVELDGYEVKLAVVPESRRIKVKKIGEDDE